MANPFKQNIPQSAGNMVSSIKSFLNNPENKEQVQLLWKEYQTNPIAFYRHMIANNPSIQNNPICKMLLSGNVNPNTILMQNFGISQQDIENILTK